MKTELQKIGLTERESEAYLALLNFEEATASQIAKTTKEHRTNIYDSLNSLIKKGLISHVLKNNVNYYKISSGEKLLNFIKEKEDLANQILPQIEKKINKKQEKPQVEVYEGLEGMKSVLSLIIKEGKTLYAFGASEEWEKQMPIYLEQYMRKRKERSIKAKLLYTIGTKPIKSPLNEIRFLPSHFKQPFTIGAFSNYVVVFMYTEPQAATLTKSRQYADSVREYFNLLWQTAKKPKP